MCAGAVFAALAAMLIMIIFYNNREESTFLKSIFSGKYCFALISHHKCKRGLRIDNSRRWPFGMVAIKFLLVFFVPKVAYLNHT